MTCQYFLLPETTVLSRKSWSSGVMYRFRSTLTRISRLNSRIPCSCPLSGQLPYYKIATWAVINYIQAQTAQWGTVELNFEEVSLTFSISRCFYKIQATAAFFRWDQRASSSRSSLRPPSISNKLSIRYYSWAPVTSMWSVCHNSRFYGCECTVATSIGSVIAFLIALWRLQCRQCCPLCFFLGYRQLFSVLSFQKSTVRLRISPILILWK